MKMFYRLFLCALILGGVCFVENAHAVPAVPGSMVVTQPDGSKLTIRLYGDEFASYMTTDDGYGIRQGEDGFYYYINSGTNRSATKVRAKNAAQRTSADRQAMTGASMGVPFAEMQAKREMALAKMDAIAADPGMQALQQLRREKMNSGEKFKSIVILVNFQDVQFTIPDANNEFSRLLNEPGYTKTNVSDVGSAWDYYNENSNGQFDPQFDVFGPYTVSENMKYYGEHIDDDKVDRAPELMIKEACELASADGVDFSQYADNGTVRDVFVFYAGYAQSDSPYYDTVWPHRWYLYSGAGINLTLNGVRVNGYACAGELRYSRQTMSGISTFCHEYGHVIGFPDYYATNYANVLTPSTYFLMDLGSHNDEGRTPPSLSVMNRFLAGWIEPEELTSFGSYELPHVSENKGYIIRISGTEGSNRGEFFTLETRSTSTNKWDAGMSGTRDGLFVMRIDRTNAYMSRWSYNTLNNSANHPCAMPVRAVTTNTETAWVFPGTAKVTSLSQTAPSHGQFKPWNGSDMPFELKNISYADGKVTFDLTIQPDGISFAEPEYYMYAGDTAQLTPVLEPAGAGGSRMEWNSSDTRVARVDDDGNVTAVAAGQAEITINVVGKSLSAICTVVVEKGMGDIVQRYVYQNDAEFYWDASPDTSITGYSIAVTDSGNATVYSTTTDQLNVYVPYLTPGKAYVITITTMGGDSSGRTATANFTTKTASGDFAYMNIAGSYSSGADVPLHVFDVQGEISSIVWKVGGREVSAPSVQLASGRHEITATVTTKDNHVETITKFVTIN